MAISYERQSITIEDVKGISVSDIVLDETSGDYVRTLYIYTQDSTATNRRPVLELRLTDAQSASLQIATPTLAF